METRGPAVVGRRDVLHGGAVLVATVAVSGCASLFTRKRDADVGAVLADGSIQVKATAAPWVKDGGQGQLVVDVGGREGKILVFRDPDGLIVAADMTCTHRGCDVDYVPEKGRLVCPCHGSEYSPTGGVLRGPAPRPLATYPVAVDDQWIVVHLG